MTFVASANAVEMTGATPVFVDVGPRDFQIAPETAERWITPRTRAIMAVHLWGTVSVMEPVLELARRRDLLVLEDAAQAVGVRRNGRHAGTFGHAGTFSFFADKSVTTGEGGFVCTEDEAVADRLEAPEESGTQDGGEPSSTRRSATTSASRTCRRPSDLVQLGKLPEIKERKLKNVESYRERLAGVAEVAWFEPPRARTGFRFAPRCF